MSLHAAHARDSLAPVRFLGATRGYVDALVTAYINGADMGAVIPGTGRVEAEHFASGVITALLLDKLPLGIDDISSETAASDFPMLALHERLEDAAGELPFPERAPLYERARRVLRCVAETPIATAAIWYRDIYAELAHGAAHRRDPEAIELAKRAIADTVFREKGRDLRPELRDLAHVSLRLGHDDGAAMFASVLRHDPADIWTYVVLGHAADDAGMPDLGAHAARRGLDVLAPRTDGDAHSLRTQLKERLADGPGRHVERVDVSEVALAGLRAALDAPGAGTGATDVELAHALVPDLASVRRKRDPEEADLVPRDQVLDMFRGHAAGSPPARAQAARPPRVGRNETCPCGTGKKYKRCCGSAQATR